MISSIISTPKLCIAHRIALEYAVYRPFLVSNRVLLYMLNIDIVWHYFTLQYLQKPRTTTSRFETDIADCFLRLPVIKWSEPVTLKSRICILLLLIFTLVCYLLIDSTLKANKNNSIQICLSVHRKAFGIYLLALNFNDKVRKTSKI